VIIYSNNYFNFTNKYHQLYWQYGYKEAVNFIKSHSKTNVYFLESIEQGYIFYLFYEKYDPEKYISNGGSAKRENCFKIDNRYFGKCNDRIKSKEIYITSGQSLKKNDIKLIEYDVDAANSVSVYQSK